MDRDAIARAERRRQAEEALDFEREREAALQEQLNAIVTEQEGPRIDADAFSAMRPEDVALIRETFEHVEDEPEEEDWLDESEPEEDEADEHEAEIGRLQDEIAGSRRRQDAFERYIRAVGE